MVDERFGMPLRGRTLLVTRPLAESEELAKLVQKWGGEAVIAPLIEIRFPPIDAAVLRGNGAFDAAAVTSVNGVRGWFAATGGNQRFSCAMWYAVGEQTCRALADYGIRAVVPVGCRSADDLAAALCRAEEKGRLLYPCGQLAQDRFRKRVTACGWSVTPVVCYETGFAPWPQTAWIKFLAAPAPRALLLFSPSAVRSFAQHVTRSDNADGWRAGTVVACVGKTTARACEEAGIRVHAVPDRPDREALLRAAAKAMDALETDQKTQFSQQGKGDAR